MLIELCVTLSIGLILLIIFRALGCLKATHGSLPEHLKSIELTDHEKAKAQDQPLQVIKAVRERTGLGLRDAKALVDQHRH
jgi:ribosomal protein L7/L12